MSQKGKKEYPQDSFEEKKILTKMEINELLNISDDIPDPKKDNKNDLKKQKYNNNQEPGNVLNNIDQKMNDYYQIKIKEEQKDEKQAQ